MTDPNPNPEDRRDDEFARPDEILAAGATEAVSFSRRVRRWLTKNKKTILLTLGGIALAIFTGWYFWALWNFLTFVYSAQPVFFWTFMGINAGAVGFLGWIFLRVSATPDPQIAGA